MEEFNNISDIISIFKKNLDAAIDSYKNEISGIRTGRVSASLLNAVVVKAYGNNMHINQVANVTVQDSRVLIVQVWDPSNVDSVNKAIIGSDLGLTPMVEGSVLKIIVPPLSQERRQELAKAVAKCAERCKISLRNIRRNNVDIVKKFAKDNSISEDIVYKTINEVDGVIAKYMQNVDNISEKKSSEVLNND